ncbi:element excision factor XisH family protein [Candidatus Parabeggiatoa sp. HSG14]|uniref:element excision factor XisH family protein n=1 Tax=Candidatus Parabeggiatoa sp. HSG14 TaxID=3055593 RepID=UPI0025A92BCD|nr:element excision factor XisH family protein [Thiotrichales bacterium HSG14]
MSAKDIIHETVKTALIKDGWTITDDPYTIEFNNEFVYADLGAERVIAVEKNHDKIIVECKSFIKASPIQDFKEAFGQYMMYLPLIAKQAPEYRLYIAIDTNAHQSAFQRKIVQFLVQLHHIPLIVVDLESEEISQWIT